MRAVLTVLLIWLPLVAAAGAWPRGEGRSFLSLSTLISTDGGAISALGGDLNNYSSAYGEYGLSPDWTLGADLFYGTGTDEDTYGGLVFARRTLLQLQGGHIVAGELGLGWIEETDEKGSVRIRPGLAWGKGFESRWGGGWMSVDASVEYRLSRNDMVVKLDATAGLRPWAGWMVIAQIQTGHFAADGFVLKLAPSVAYELGEGRHLQLGLSIGVAGDDAIGVKLAHWWAF